MFYNEVKYGNHAWSLYMLTMHEEIKESYNTEPSWFRKICNKKVKQVASELEYITEPTATEKICRIR